MDPAIEVLTDYGVLAAGYQPAAILSSCVVRRYTRNIGQQTSQFTAHINHANSYWIKHPTYLILQLSQNTYWRWEIKEHFYSKVKVEGLIIGDPDILSSIPIQLRRSA